MYKKRLLELGIPANLLGLHYLNKGLELYTMGCKMSNLYCNIAKEFNTTPSRVERAMRHAISCYVDEQSTENINHTNSSFLAAYKLILWADSE